MAAVNCRWRGLRCICIKIERAAGEACPGLLRRDRTALRDKTSQHSAKLNRTATGDLRASAHTLLQPSTCPPAVRIFYMSNLEESGHQAGKIALGSEGLGTVSPDLVDKRARE